MNDVAMRREAIAQAMDLSGLEEATVAALADRAQVERYGSGQPISIDDERTTGLYIVVEGLVAVTSRSEHRRAPVTVVLGPGGVFGEDSLAETGMMGAEAYRRSTVLFIPAETIRSLAQGHADLARVTRRLVEIQRNAPWIIDQLRRSPLFENVPPAEVYPLLEGATLQVLAPDEVLVGPKDALDGLVLVLEGELKILQPEGVVVDGQVQPSRPFLLSEGAVLGDHCLIRPGPLRHRVEAGNTGGRVIHFRTDVFRDQFGNSPAFRRGVFASPMLEVGERRAMMLAHARADIALGRSNWVGLVGDADLPLPLMTQWLAKSAAAEWGDRVMVVHLDPSAPARPDMAQAHYRWPNEVALVTINPRFDSFNRDLVRLALMADTVYLDFGHLDPLDWPEWLGRVRRTVYVASRPYEPVGDTLLDQVSRPLVYTAVVPAPPPDAGEVRVVHRGGVRIHRDLVAAARRGTSLAELTPDLRAQVSRWMRGVTQRRIGIALGGGGALAFAHVALIQELTARGVPIDMVAGVSGGSVVGAFYAAGGHLQPDPSLPVPEGLEHLPGLARLIQLGEEFAAVCRLAPVSSGVVADWIDRQLGGVRLEDLLLPFFPVAADIDQAVQIAIRTGPIGFGVRASGSFPGPFTPTTLDRHELAAWRHLPWRRGRELPSPEPGQRQHYRYVDGGIINNIPDDTLYLEGAQAVVASNVVPAPQSRAETSTRHVRRVQRMLQRGSSRLARMVREVDPVVRIDDAMRSGYMMMHTPADWAARVADAKYQARTVGYTFTDWGDGDAIRRQALQEPQRADLVRAAGQIERRIRAMQWVVDSDMGEDQLLGAIARNFDAL